MEWSLPVVANLGNGLFVLVGVERHMRRHPKPWLHLIHQIASGIRLVRASPSEGTSSQRISTLASARYRRREDLPSTAPWESRRKGILKVLWG
jgi:hypothetical protein